jgi:hypothetical protein
VAIDLSNSSFVKLTKGLDAVIETTEEIVLADLKNENALEERVREMLEEHEAEIEYNFADEKELFRMVKKKLAPQYNFLISHEDRFNHLSYQVLKGLIARKLIEFKVSEIKVKGLIFDSIENYIDDRFNVEDRVLERIKSYKRKLIPGTDEYQIVFQKLYENELRAKGNM